MPDWYRLLGLCALTRTLIADTDGLYHAGDFNDRLVSASREPCQKPSYAFCVPGWTTGFVTKRLVANCAAACRLASCGATPTARSCSIRTRPVVNAIRTVFERFAETGSARRVWLWFRSNNLLFPLQDAKSLGREVCWVVPTYHAIHGVLIHPCYTAAS
jgi:hypothetical protein